jgi:hypothetical protein
VPIFDELVALNKNKMIALKTNHLNMC